MGASWPINGKIYINKNVYWIKSLALSDLCESYLFTNMHCPQCMRKNLILGHVNIKSIHNGYKPQCSITEVNIDIVIKSETNLD